MKLKFIVIALSALLGSAQMAVAETVDLTKVPFWQVSSGHWANQNTYLNEQLEYKIKSYYSFVTISVSPEQVVMKEVKFYPAGGFNGKVIGLDIPENKGVEYINTTIATSFYENGVVELESAPGAVDAQTLITPFTNDTAMLTTTDKKTGIDSYRMFITLPNANYRYVTNIGIGSHAEPDSALDKQGALRGLSFFKGVRLSAEDMTRQILGWRKKFDVETVVTLADGRFQVERLAEAKEP